MSIGAARREVYISGNQATQMLGWGWHRLYKAVLSGEIRARKLPGRRDPRFSLQDVERIRGEIGGSDHF